MLHTQHDYDKVQKAKRKIWLNILISSIIFIAIIILCSIIRIDWPGYIVSVLWAIFVVSYWGLKGSRIKKYYHLLKDMNEGLEKNITGAVESIDTSINVKDTLDFYLILLREDGVEDDTPARKLYFDASKKLPDYKEGARLEVCLFGNYIKNIKPL